VAFLTSRARSYLFVTRFDFDSFRKNEQLEWNGPKEGERIDLTQFRTEQAESFPQFPANSLILLAVIDPRCKMCRRSADLMEQVQAEVRSHGVNFLIVSFVSDVQKEEFFAYAKTLCKADEIFLWEGEKELVLPALRKMVLPSHILINEEGIVLRRFPGSSNDKAIRDQMAKQIIAETLAEKANLK
jgi:hypothetical protein